MSIKKGVFKQKIRNQFVSETNKMEEEKLKNMNDQEKSKIIQKKVLKKFMKNLVLLKNLIFIKKIMKKTFQWYQNQFQLR